MNLKIRDDVHRILDEGRVRPALGDFSLGYHAAELIDKRTKIRIT